PVSSLERRGAEWIVNGSIRARMLIGAGGTFCPAARHFGAKSGGETAVVAREAEVEIGVGCAVRGEIPELYFCADMKGYGWCFRKGNLLNVGLGRFDSKALPEH